MIEHIKRVSASNYPGGFTHLRLVAEGIAEKARPGQWIIWGSRTLYIMRSDPQTGCIELLFTGKTPHQDKIEGPGGDAPVLPEVCFRSLLVGGVEALAQLIFFADSLRKRRSHTTLLLLQATQPLPFTPTPCRIMIPGMPAGVIATLPLLSDWGVALRIASNDGLPGCYHGSVDELAEQWLSAQPRPSEIACSRL
ncbi:MAG: hypothetical protein L3J94_01075 [Gammaproteobacteria bacterium]|nr:hypothetical protein [Gammaproteobacteria bacterium]